ncbi:hypothetical protein DIPPA_02248 [Diplonema papillatum]|nr:hypothetical protein DIPPA_02248 [Diplonema papillatum]
MDGFCGDSKEQAAVHRVIAAPLAARALGGTSCVLIAYGAERTGKTLRPGVLFLALFQHLFCRKYSFQHWFCRKYP